MKYGKNVTGVGRRDFLGYSASAGLLWAAGGLAGNAGAVESDEAASKEKEAQAMSKVSYWMHGFGGDDPEATAEALRAAGFDVVVAGGGAVIEAVNRAGMKSWLCGGAFGLGDLSDDDSVKARDINGNPQIWFSSGCPNQPILRERNLESYRQMAATDGVEGILVDGCRFASPASGLYPFLTCFCDTCREKAGRLGFDFDRMHGDVKALCALLVSKGEEAKRGADWLETPTGVVEWLTYHSGVLDWLRFRRTCATEHFRDVSQIIHDGGKQMGVYIFTPSLAPLVGQSYVDLREFVDVFSPMIYRNYPDYPGPACLNWELTNIPKELGLAGTPRESTAMDLVLSYTGLADAVSDRNIADIQQALPPDAVGNQTKLARALLGPDKTLIPIIYIDDPLMKESAQFVRENGANGVNFFVYKEKWPEMVKPGIVR